MPGQLEGNSPPPIEIATAVPASIDVHPASAGIDIANTLDTGLMSGKLSETAGIDQVAHLDTFSPANTVDSVVPPGESVAGMQTVDISIGSNDRSAASSETPAMAGPTPDVQTPPAGPEGPANQPVSIDARAGQAMKLDAAGNLVRVEEPRDNSPLGIKGQVDRDANGDVGRGAEQPVQGAAAEQKTDQTTPEVQQKTPEQNAARLQELEQKRKDGTLTEEKDMKELRDLKQSPEMKQQQRKDALNQKLDMGDITDGEIAELARLNKGEVTVGSPEEQAEQIDKQRNELAGKMIADAIKNGEYDPADLNKLQALSMQKSALENGISPARAQEIWQKVASGESTGREKRMSIQRNVQEKLAEMKAIELYKDTQLPKTVDQLRQQKQSLLGELRSGNLKPQDSEQKKLQLAGVKGNLRTVRSEVSVLDAKHNQLDTDVNVMLGIDTGFAAVVGIIAADVHLGFAKAMATLDSEILARE